ncbi:MAG: hypothetical protein LH472_09520 [Pyrinomonadaceae bacterium]|nr:hypothetical protein [Pyrinomonadaceae bacterium]
MRNENKFFAFVSIVALLSFAGCQIAPTNSNQSINANISPINTSANSNLNDANAAKSGTHEHRAPHGGTLIAFGEEFAHLELVFDSMSGELKAYALDGEAEKSVRLTQSEIEIEVEKPRRFRVKLAAAENALTGEKKGATSEFRASSNELKNLKEFDAKIVSITIRGREFKNTHFNFPKGNENEHGH